jgi:hypothetical protein
VNVAAVPQSPPAPEAEAAADEPMSASPTARTGDR